MTFTEYTLENTPINARPDCPQCTAQRWSLPLSRLVWIAALSRQIHIYDADQVLRDTRGRCRSFDLRSIAGSDFGGESHEKRYRSSSAG